MPTIPEAAKRLGLAPGTLRIQIRLKKLRAYNMGGRWFVTDDEIERYRLENKRPETRDVA